jgi:hypothetical protein
LDEYDLKKDDEIITTLTIEISTSILPRYSCACHKSNIAVRAAIKNHQELAKDLKRLSKFASKAKKSIYESIALNENKCRLRTESKTRWSASFLMLVSIKKAYEREALTSSCPVDIAKIDVYIQILKPAYKFSILLQRNNSSIADVGPNLLFMFNKWNKFVVDASQKSLCKLLIDYHIYKFDFELNSRIYRVASILNVAKLHLWFKQDFAQPYVASALKAIQKVALKFLRTNKNDKQDQDEQNNESILDESQATQKSDMSRYAEQEDEELGDPMNEHLMLAQIENEKASFLNILRSKSLEEFKSTTSFWHKNRKKFPNLYKLSLILLNIPSSSAYIERFFSICGFVCDTRRGNMSTSLTIKRCLLSANIDILNELAHEEK